MDARSRGPETITKRLSQRWQASGSYTLSWLYDMSAPAVSGTQVVPFPVAPDLGGEYSLAVTDQRHRATFNGIGATQNEVPLVTAGQELRTVNSSRQIQLGVKVLF